MTTNVPPIVWTPTGLQLPQESDILAGVLDDMDAAFGGGMNKGLTTPQGQLAQSQAAIIGDANDNFALMVNQVNPATASGFMQDAIGSIYFLDRHPAQSSTAVCQCIGAVGTVIPINSQAVDQQGNIWLSTAAATVPVGGSVNIQFACQETGAIACPAGTLNKIYQSIPGWDTINNPSDAVLGNDAETRAEFEYRRQNSVALNAKGSTQSIYAAVFSVAGVTDCYVIDNPSNAPVSVGTTNYTLSPHSVYVAAAGGLAQDVANAIWTKKDLGCDMNGNTPVQVLDTTYNFPQPSYKITFNIPTATPILFRVDLVNNVNLPSNIVDLVKAAIIAAFTGADGGSRARIAGIILASRYYSGVASLGNGVEILTILLGISAATLNSITMGIDQEPTIDASNIIVNLV